MCLIVERAGSRFEAIYESIHKYHCMRRRIPTSLGATGAVLLGTLTLLIWGCSATGSLRRPTDNIRVSLLKKTPLGMPRDAVGAYVGKERWENLTAPGSKNIDVVIGAYQNQFLGPSRTEVFVSWLFDTNGQLHDISVSKFSHGY